MSLPTSLNLDQLPLLVTAQGEFVRELLPTTAPPGALLPGSFNPLHAGHWELAAAAQKCLARTVPFEISVTNVDKPELSMGEVRRRLMPFLGRADVWITRAPRFANKAELFPGTTFVVGADTALRLLQARYYGDDLARMTHALETIREQRCRILVGGRLEPTGRFLTLADLPVPSAYRDLFQDIPAGEFRCDLSSTTLRGP